MWQTTRKKKLENNPKYLDELEEQNIIKILNEGNPNHAPKGSSKGGQFTKGDGGSGSDDDKKDDTNGDTKKRKFKVGIVNDKKKLDNAEKILNDLPDDYVNKDIFFTDNPNPRLQGLHQFHKAEIYLNNIPDEDIGSVITHELGHAHFGDFKDYDRSSFGAIAMTLPKISTYSDGFKQEITNTLHSLKNAKNNFKSLPDNASDDDKHLMRVRYENAQIDHSLAIANYADEYYADLQSYIHGFPPKTKTDVSKEDIDNIIKKTDEALKGEYNKQIYNTTFPALAKESTEDVALSGDHSRADVGKKKKKRFEFVEAIDDSWREVEHYLIEDSTNSGQKSDTVGNPEFKAFTHSSSFVGNVLWDRESREMDILLNGNKYHFCNVSERLFDSFEGAGSKGAFFNREIKTLHDC